MIKYMKMLALTPVWLTWWAVQIMVKAPFALLGLVVIPYMWTKKNTPLHELNWAERLFANPEDWYGGHYNFADSLPPWWVRSRGVSFKSFYLYHAIRNPADGLRNIPQLQAQIEQHRVQYVASQYLRYWEPEFVGNVPGVYWYIAWQGHNMGLNVMWIRDTKYVTLKLGMRIEPRDSVEPVKGSRGTLGGSMATKLVVRDLPKLP